MNKEEDEIFESPIRTPQLIPTLNDIIVMHYTPFRMEVANGSTSEYH